MTKQKSIELSNLTVERTKKNTFKICWEAKAKEIVVSVYAGNSPDTINRQSPVAAINNADSVEIADLDADALWYFEVFAGNEHRLMVSERAVRFDGVVNFRDLGGYDTKDGRRVKWGRVFRSGHLSDLTQKDQQRIKQLGIKTICDFRSPGEKEMRPNWLPPDGSIQYLELPIVHGEFDPVAAMESLQKGDVSWLTEDFIITRYIKKIDDFGHVWGRFFNQLADAKNRPLVFHCTAGKDRAGTAAALTLLALGVPEETVIYDHGLSNVYIAHVLEVINQRIKKIGIDPQKVEPYFTAPRNAIVAVVNHIRKTYGSAAKYLQTKAGISEEKLELLREELLD
jgi:protein-tyrosine phosphatase